ncbi:mucin-2 [Amyelois transitella]|uniref:mucin-2 n=1 Tax=Amyelois transitella TaxID=680683 RepID=UPI00067B962C|nr:mucin-2 [Amyelois transitella]XP_013195695.1 mucin-2 [Amyelois transitella]
MTMESPVRICLGAALVVHLLLLSSTIVSGNALPHETTSTAVKDETNPRTGRTNTTAWVPRQNVKSPDVSLNELSPKESPTEENTEKNAKYKHRGRVRFNPQAKSTTESNLRRVKSTTETPNVIIVTPTPEVKKPAQIIDSMRTYKRTKMPVVSTTASSTTSSSSTIRTSTMPLTKIVKKEVESHSEEEEEYEDENEEEKESLEKYSSSDFDSNFFTIPSYNDFPGYQNSDTKIKDFSSPSFGGFSTFFPSFGPKDKDHESYSSDSFFDFGSELTTPKNDFFDKKFQEISESIQKKIAYSAPKSKSNSTNVHIIKENIGLERLNNNTPSNKSTVYIKNTKEIRLLDNEGAGTANKELSDVQGTSIYYEMSVLSTETYAINSDDDCDNDTSPTASTSAEEELAPLKGSTKPIYSDPLPLKHSKRNYPDPISKSTSSTKPTLGSINPTYSNISSETISTLSSHFLPVSSLIPDVYNSISPVPISTQNSVYSLPSTPSPINGVSSNGVTDRTIKIYSSSFTRNRSYSKRLNLNGTRDSPNSVTSSTNTTSVSSKPHTRRFHHTTPKNKAIWMAPRRNITRVLPTRPTTIYSEHFNIRDKYSSTPRNHQPNKTTLTTVSSDIDPVLQTDIGGVEKVVHSPSISDNSIPSVWKRGSTKYTTSTSTSSETGGISDLEIPPTLTAWALASLRSPPVLASATNVTVSTQKSFDENELQKVGDVTDKKEILTGTSTTVPNTLNNDIETKKTIEVEQNKLPWRPIFSPTKPKTTTKSDTPPKKSESLPAESVISVQSSAKPAETTDNVSPQTTISPKEISDTQTWVPVTMQVEPTTESSELKTVPTVGATRTTSFESITKLPTGVTTPQDETLEKSEQKNHPTIQDMQTPTTTDFEITTIRFSYVPTEELTESTESSETSTSIPMTNTNWHAVFPTRTRQTTIKDEPITTYRPMYTTSDEIEETTILQTDTSTSVDVSSEEVTMTEKIANNGTEKIELMNQTNITSANVNSETTSSVELVTDEITTTPTNEMILPHETTTLLETTIHPETTSIVTEIVTEINTEIQTKTSTETMSTTETSAEIQDTDCTSEENSDSNEIITQVSPKLTTVPKISLETTTTPKITTEVEVETTTEITTVEDELTTDKNAKIYETTTVPTTTQDQEESTTDSSTRSVSDLEDVSSYNGDMTTEANARVTGVDEDTGSGAAVAIAVSTIGVIALILLIGLLLIVRRRGRRGVYAQRCTPVSLDAYSLDSVSVGHRKGNHRLRASKRSYGNPAYDDEVTSHPMQYAALANFAMDVESMTAEFTEIPSVTVRPDEVPHGCEDKNRYSNVLPLPETRVPLKRMGNDPTSEYINANYITGPGNIRNYYIACQAPLSNTVVDFWRMIWEQNSRLIVMLTEYMENGVEKCYEYLPPSEVSDNRRTFGDYQIILKKREQRDKYAISTVQLINLGTRTWREVTHMWYFWPAKGVPDDYDSIIDFLSEMRSYMKISQTAKEYDEEGVEVIYGDMNRSSFGNLSKLRSDDSGSGNGLNVYSPAKAEEQMRRGNVTNGTLGRMKTASEIEGIRPCVVTCASGAGRSAALIAADVCARALAAGAADVPRVVRELRAQRPHSLSNRHHYIFLYKVLSEYGNKLMGGGVDTI